MGSNAAFGDDPRRVVARGASRTIATRPAETTRAIRRLSSPFVSLCAASGWSSSRTSRARERPARRQPQTRMSPWLRWGSSNGLDVDHNALDVRSRFQDVDLPVRQTDMRAHDHQAVSPGRPAGQMLLASRGAIGSSPART